MTVEEYFEEWWTPKELPKNGFNKTALLDFAEMYHKQALRIHDVGRSEHRTFFPDGRTTSATKCQFCGKEKWEH